MSNYKLIVMRKENFLKTEKQNRAIKKKGTVALFNNQPKISKCYVITRIY